MHRNKCYLGSLEAPVYYEGGVRLHTLPPLVDTSKGLSSGCRKGCAPKLLNAVLSMNSSS